MAGGKDFERAPMKVAAKDCYWAATKDSTTARNLAVTKAATKDCC